MYKSTILTFALLAFSSMVFAQTNPIDFEDGGNGADYTWTVFENGTNPDVEVIDNPDASGANTSAKVGKFTAVLGGQEYAGAWTNGSGTFILDETNRIITIKVWKSVISDVGVKLEAAGGWSEGEIKVANTKINEWEEITFDFSDKNNPPAEQGGEFAVITIFPDFSARTDTNIVYFDDLTFGDGGTSEAPAVFFSEYVEGSSNNKALEIYNGTGETLSLADYQIAQSSNGGGWAFFHTFADGAEIAAGDVYVLITDQVDPLLFDAANADEVLGFPSPIHFNGNDARAIVHISGTDTTVIDVIGDPDSDTVWDVAGVSEATSEQTLIRKSSVMMGNPTPLASFGTNADDSEWIVNDQNDFSNLGMYGMGPETVDITFTVNMSTLQDTVNSDSYSLYINGAMRGQYVEVDGRPTFVGGETLGWDTQATATMMHMGGDYWTATYTMFKGDTLLYKYRYQNDITTANDDDNSFDGAANALGWDTRGLIATADTVLPVDYFNERGDSPLPEDLQPFTSADDSITVYFRVNVGGQVQTGDLDPETGKVGVRGNPVFFDNPGDWSSTAFYLENLGGSGDNLFFGGSAKIQKDSAATVMDAVGYKFVIEAEDGTVTWESTPDNFFSMPEMDSTTYWRFFSDTPPTDAVVVDTKLNFEVNVGILEGIGFFNSAIDTVFVRGTFNGWNTDNQMTFNDISGNYDALNIDRTAAVDSEELYKYYIKWDARRDSAENEFYLAGITHDGSGWEEPGVTGGADRSMMIENTDNQPVRSESYNGVEPQALLTPGNVEGGAITVTFSVDMSPAAARDDGTTPFDATTDSVFLFVDTPFFALTNDIVVPGDGGDQFINQTDEQRDRVRFTDPDEDMIYTLDLPLMLPTLNHIGFRIAYGEPTAENGEIIANGGGFDAGRRHYQYIQPIVSPDGSDLDEQPDVTWPATFTMPMLTWAKDNLPWDAPPDYSTITNSSELEGDNANRFVLNQNYPNPFNPSTNISFSMPNAANVTLKVYNVLGQEVASLINNKALNSGAHTVAFDASALSSGMYIYRIEAGSFVSTKRMMLIK